MEKEIWKHSLSENGVLVSSLGRVLLPPRHAPMYHGGYRLYETAPRYGDVSKSSKEASHTYLHVMVFDCEKRQRTRKVHQLVCEAFHGVKPFDEAVVIHIDEDSHNNRPDNLKWGTQKENLNGEKFIAYCKTRTGMNNPFVKGRAAKCAKKLEL